MAVLFLSHAEDGVADQPVASSVWNYTVSGQSPLSQLYYRDATPVPGSGRSKYFQNNVEGDNGTMTASGSVCTDNSKNWPVNRWAPGPDEPYKLTDSAGTIFNIVSNTATTITVSAGSPVTGTYVIGGQHDSYNEKSVSQIPLTPGTTYYLAGFTRVDRINGINAYHVVDGSPDNSYDKHIEFSGSARALIQQGFPDWATCSGGNCVGKFTFGPYLAFETCTSCIYEQVEPNVSPYTRNNFILADYGKWYAVVLGFTPSNGATADGRLQFWVNGIKTHDYQNIKTQDSGTPYVDAIRLDGTLAQNFYDAPAQLRKVDYIIFSDSLTDIQNAGLMEDPEAAASQAEGGSSLFNRRFWGIPGHIGHDIH